MPEAPAIAAPTPPPTASSRPSPQAHADTLMAAARQQMPDVSAPQQRQQAAKEAAVAKEAPKVEAKPEVKKGVERIPTLTEPAKEDVQQQQETTTTQTAEDDQAKQKTWDKYKASHKWREQAEPEYETLKKEKAEWATKQEEFQKTQKELEDHRQFRAAYDWQNGTNYQEKVAKPMAVEWKNAAQVADYLGADKMKLEQAMLESNPLKRDELIEAVLSETGKEVKPSALQRVCDAATALAKINDAADQMEREALDLQSAITGRKQQETTKQTAEREATWNKASDEIARAYSTKFAPLLAKNPEIAKALREARIADDPMDQAMQAQSAEILPHVTSYLIEVLKENAEHKKFRKALNGAKPTLGGEQTPTDQPKQHANHTEALAAAAAQHFGKRF